MGHIDRGFRQTELVYTLRLDLATTDGGNRTIHWEEDAGRAAYPEEAYDELRRVAELLHVPVTTSWAARGVLPETSEFAVPMPFITVNNEVRNDADLVLALGSRLGETDWWGKAPYWRHPSEQQMIQVDIDGHVLGAYKPVALAVLADARLFLAALAERLTGLTGRMNLDARRRKVARYRDKVREERARLDEKLADMAVPMNPAHVAHACQQAFPESRYRLEGRQQAEASR